MARELDARHLLPPRVDWRGVVHAGTVAHQEARWSGIDLRSRLPDLLSELQRRVGAASLLACGRLSALCDPNAAAAASMARPRDLVSLLRTRSADSLHEIYSRLRIVKTLCGHGHPVYCATFDAHGERVLTGSDDQNLKLWSTRSGALLGVFRGHKSAVCDICISPDNRYIAAGAQDGSIRVWSLATFEPVAVLLGHRSAVTGVSFSPCGRFLLSGAVGALARIWRTDNDFEAQPTLVFDDTVLVPPARPPAAFAAAIALHEQQFFPPIVGGAASVGGDGARGGVGAANADGGAVPFAPESVVQHAAPIDDPPTRSASSAIACFGLAGTVLAIVGAASAPVAPVSTRVAERNTGPAVLRLDALPPSTKKNVVRLFNVELLSCVCELIGHAEEISALRFAANQTTPMLCSGGDDGSVRVWSFGDAFRTDAPASLVGLRGWRVVLLDAVPARAGRVNTVVWALDDQRIVAVHEDKTIRVWNAASGALLHELARHTDDVFTLAVNPLDTRVVMSGGHDGLVVFWDVQRGCALVEFATESDLPAGNRVLDGSFASSGQHACIANFYGELHLFGFGAQAEPLMRRYPTEQFLPDEASPLLYDRYGWCVDAQTREPWHLLPRRALVDFNGAGHDDAIYDTGTPPMPSETPALRRAAEARAAARAEAALRVRRKMPALWGGGRRVLVDQALHRPAPVSSSSSVRNNLRSSASRPHQQAQQQQQQGSRVVNLGTLQRRRPRGRPRSDPTQIIYLPTPPSSEEISDDARRGAADDSSVDMADLVSDAEAVETDDSSVDDGDDASARRARRRRRVLRRGDDDDDQHSANEANQRRRTRSQGAPQPYVPERRERDRPRRSASAVPPRYRDDPSDDDDGNYGASRRDPSARRSSSRPMRRSTRRGGGGDEEEFRVNDESSDNRHNRHDGDSDDEAAGAVSWELQEAQMFAPWMLDVQQPLVPGAYYPQRLDRVVYFPQAHYELILKHRWRRNPDPPRWVTQSAQLFPSALPCRVLDVVHGREGRQYYVDVLLEPEQPVEGERELTIAVIRDSVAAADNNSSGHESDGERRDSKKRRVSDAAATSATTTTTTTTAIATLTRARQRVPLDEELRKPFVVRHLPMCDEPDCLVLRGHVERAVRVPWQKQLRMRSFFHDTKQWARGVVLDVAQCSVKAAVRATAETRDSLWNCVQVQWDRTHAIESISPWEIEPLAADAADHADDAGEYNEPPPALTAAELDEQADADTLHAAMRRVWGAPIDAAAAAELAWIAENRARHLRAFDALLSTDVVRLFADDVDFQRYPEYARAVSAPMSVRRIRERIRHLWYRRRAALEDDIDLILVASQQFNSLEHEITRRAAVVRQMCVAALDSVSPTTDYDASNLDDVMALCAALTVQRRQRVADARAATASTVATVFAAQSGIASAFGVAAPRSATAARPSAMSASTRVPSTGAMSSSSTRTAATTSTRRHREAVSLPPPPLDEATISTRGRPRRAASLRVQNYYGFAALRDRDEHRRAPPPPVQHDHYTRSHDVVVSQSGRSVRAPERLAPVSRRSSSGAASQRHALAGGEARSDYAARSGNVIRIRRSDVPSSALQQAPVEQQQPPPSSLARTRSAREYNEEQQLQLALRLSREQAGLAADDNDEDAQRDHEQQQQQRSTKRKTSTATSSTAAAAASTASAQAATTSTTVAATTTKHNGRIAATSLSESFHDEDDDAAKANSSSDEAEDAMSPPQSKARRAVARTKKNYDDDDATGTVSANDDDDDGDDADAYNENENDNAIDDGDNDHDDDDDDDDGDGRATKRKKTVAKKRAPKNKAKKVAAKNKKLTAAAKKKKAKPKRSKRHNSDDFDDDEEAEAMFSDEEELGAQHKRRRARSRRATNRSYEDGDDDDSDEY